MNNVQDIIRHKENYPFNRKSTLWAETSSWPVTWHKMRKNIYVGIVEYLNKITPQLMDSFHTASNEKRYLRNATLGRKWATTPLKNISKAQYNFHQLMMAFNESIQREREIHNVSTSFKTHDGQLTEHSNNVRKYDYSHRCDSGNHGEYRSQQYDDPYSYSHWLSTRRLSIG